MKKVNKKINNLNIMFVTKQKVVFWILSFLLIFFIIFHLSSLFFNVKYTYAIENSKKEILEQQNLTASLQAKFLREVSEIKKTLNNEKHIPIKNIVYLNSGVDSVAFAK